MSIEKNAKIEYNLYGVFGAEQRVEGNLGKGIAGIQEMFDSYNNGPNGSPNNKGSIGNSSFADFNDLIKFFEFCYRYEVNSGRYPRTGVDAADTAIGLKINFINKKLEEEKNKKPGEKKMPGDIKLKLISMRQMLEDVKKNGGKPNVYKDNSDFSVTAQTDSQNRLHTRVVFDPNDDHNYVGLRRVGEGEFESLDRVTLFKDIEGSLDSYRAEIDKEGNCVISKFVGKNEECVECSDLDEKTRESIVRVAKASLEKLKQKENGREEEASTPPVKSKPQPTKSTDSSVSKRNGILAGFTGANSQKNANTFNTPPSVNSARLLKKNTEIGVRQ